ncbi:MAG TPA: glycosyltransferase family 2 protein [Bacteroidia bacterium]|nr:glycosyltransferase family 2 protein [Bacteroidia bacterium]HRS59526.1 glycosyltransferase family 2 protein [Bacteroidia bacterium]HRU67582.1 glycosyltransferase family 2 protein [Bacteroidia bacterium]
MPVLSIVIPAFNEEKTIISILEKVRNCRLPDGIEKEIIVIDDCSKDATASLVREYREKYPELTMKLIVHAENRGKGAAIRNGIRLAEGDYLIIQDADLEYDPDEYTEMLQPVLNGVADVVYGSRFMGGKPHRILFFWHSIGNRFLTFISNMFTNLNLTDMETCYKLFRMEIIKSIQLKEDRFGFEPEVTAKVSRIRGIRIYEIGISYYGRQYQEGKKINWKDGLRALYCILKYNLFVRR